MPDNQLFAAAAGVGGEASAEPPVGPAPSPGPAQQVVACSISSGGSGAAVASSWWARNKQLYKLSVVHCGVMLCVLLCCVGSYFFEGLFIVYNLLCTLNLWQLICCYIISLWSNNWVGCGSVISNFRAKYKVWAHISLHMQQFNNVNIYTYIHCAYIMGSLVVQRLALLPLSKNHLVLFFGHVLWILYKTSHD